MLYRFAVTHDSPSLVHVPLVPTTAENGATEFRLRVRSRKKATAATTARKRGHECDCEYVERPLRFTTAEPSVVVFDYLTLHRGGANTTDHDRPILYKLYSVPEWQDRVNWRQDSTKYRNFASNYGT